MKDQIKILEAQARCYMLIAKVMKKRGYADSMKGYIRSGQECCRMAIELQREYDLNTTKTIEFKLVA